MLIIDEGAFNPEPAAFDAIAVLGLFKPKVDPVALYGVVVFEALDLPGVFNISF